MVNSVIISSFKHSTLTQIRDFNQDIQTSVLWEKPIDEPIAYAQKLEANVISPQVYLLVPEMVQSAHEAGLKVYPHTVNDDEFMLELLKIGVDGLITDFPDIAIRVVDAFLTQYNG